MARKRVLSEGGSVDAGVIESCKSCKSCSAAVGVSGEVAETGKVRSCVPVDDLAGKVVCSSRGVRSVWTGAVERVDSDGCGGSLGGDVVSSSSLPSSSSGGLVRGQGSAPAASGSALVAREEFFCARLLRCCGLKACEFPEGSLHLDSFPPGEFDGEVTDRMLAKSGSAVGLGGEAVEFLLFCFREHLCGVSGCRWSVEERLRIGRAREVRRIRDWGASHGLCAPRIADADDVLEQYTEVMRDAGSKAMVRLDAMKALATRLGLFRDAEGRSGGGGNVIVVVNPYGGGNAGVEVKDV